MRLTDPATSNPIARGRYGFQGQEHDDEVKGEGNSVNYTFRMHDPRIGRFLTEDPLVHSYPHYSPYSFSGNKVIHCRELEGKEEIIATLSTDYNSWILTWDVTARIKGEAGKIIYQTNDGQILEKMREINDLEMREPFISRNVNMPTDDPSIEKPNREPERAGGASATCVKINGNQVCDESVPREFANPDVCPTPIPLGGGTNNTNNNNSNGGGKKNKLQMSASVKNDLLKELKGASIFGDKGNSLASSTIGVNKGTGYNGSIQDVMSKFQKYDLSKLKIEFNFTLGTSLDGQGKTNFYQEGPAGTAKDKMLQQIIDEFVASGLDKNNVSGNAFTSKSRPTGEINTTIKIK